MTVAEAAPTETTTTETTTSTPDTTESAPLTFDQAAEAALAEHSPKGEQATAPGESNPTESSADTTTTTATPTPETGLITDAEYSALETKFAGDPKGLRRALEGTFTQKTQKLAEERRSYDRLKPYAELVDAYETDPLETIERLARQHGRTLAVAGETTETHADIPAASSEAATGLVDKFKEDLGPEYEYMADAMAPALMNLVKAAMAATIEPLKAQQELIVGKAANDQTETVMQTFEKSHTDYKDHEPAMLALSQKIQPNGMSELEYLDHLYQAVTSTPAARQQAIAKGVKAALAKMEKGALEAETDRTTPEHRVTKRPPKNPSFEESAAAALRGERFD